MNLRDQPQEKQKRGGREGRERKGEEKTQSKIAVQAVNHVLLTNEYYLSLRLDLHFPFKLISLKQTVPLSNRLDKRQNKTIELQQISLYIVLLNIY